MSRARNLAVIRRALDRAALASVPLDDDETAGDEALVVAGWILDPGWGERFWVGGSKWTGPRASAAVLGYAQHAPDDELAAMAREARKQIAWCEEWDAGERLKSEGWIPLEWHDEIGGAA